MAIKPVNKSFGKLLFGTRVRADLTLREAAERVNYDASNWSKVERGLIAPPDREPTIKKWATALGLTPKSEEYEEFLTSARLARGKLPSEYIADQRITDHLPAFLRTMQHNRLTVDEFLQLIAQLRRESQRHESDPNNKT